MTSVFNITVWRPSWIVSMVTTGGQNYEMTFFGTPGPYPFNASYLKNHVQSGKTSILHCGVPLKKLKAPKLIKIELSDFVRVMNWYISTLC